MEKKYDVVLVEKPEPQGMTAEDVNVLIGMLREESFFPVEFPSLNWDSSAMGFVGKDAANRIDYDYKESGLEDFVGRILSDINLTSESREYEFKGLAVCIGLL